MTGRAIRWLTQYELVTLMGMEAGVRLSANGMVLNASQTFHDKVESQADHPETEEHHDQPVPTH